MPRQSNKALEKYNKPTAESIQAKQAKELVDDEYNDIRRQIIRREFDQVNLYNELFDANRQKFGDTLLEYKLMELFRSYINQIAESRKRLGENRPNPFNDLIGAYNAFTASLSSYVDLAKKQNSSVDVKSYQDELRESAIPLQQLLDYALGIVSGAVPSVPVAAAPAVSAREAPGLVAEREDRRRSAYEDEHPDNPFLARPRLTPQQDAAERLRRFEASQANQDWQPARPAPSAPPAPVPGRGKAHGGSAADFFKNFAMNFLLNKRVGRGKAHGGMNTDFIWKLLLGAGKAYGGNKPTENDILDLFNLLKEVQRGFVPNQPFRGVSAMTESEKKRQKSQLDAFEGADVEKKRSDIREITRIYTERLPAMEAMDVNDLRSINRVIKVLEKNKEEIMASYSKFQYAKKGEYRPNELNELKDLTKSIDTQLKLLYERKKTLGGGKAHGNHPKTDTNFGQLMAEAEARNPRKKNCHYNTRGFLISCGKGKAHGGQAGFSIEKTREIVDQWPGFPYHVPPASKTGPMLKNPRSRVNNRTEANGKPKKICKMDMSASSVACRKDDSPKKRGRPKKASPKEAAGKKKAKKSGKPKYNII